jgi:hypothetical protein
VLHAVEVSALRNDAHILVHGQNFGCTSPKNSLRVGQNDLVHDARLIRCKSRKPELNAA